MFTEFILDTANNDRNAIELAELEKVSWHVGQYNAINKWTKLRVNGIIEWKL